MIRMLLLSLVVAAPAFAAPAFADGPPVDPDWPCVQRRQPQLSLAQVWGGPVPDAAAQALARHAGGQRPRRGARPPPHADGGGRGAR